MNCKLRKLGKHGVFEDYNCNQVRELFEKWQEDFIKENRVNKSRPDRHYLEWKEQIEDFLMHCKCHEKKSFLEVYDQVKKEDNFDWEDKSDPEWFKKRIDHAKKLRGKCDMKMSKKK